MRDPTPGENKQAILDTLNLPIDINTYCGTKTIRKQKKIKISDDGENEIYVSPCFDQPTILLLTQHSNAEAKKIIDGTATDFRSLRWKDLLLYYQDMLSELVLAFGLINGPRPADYYTMNVEQLGEYSLELDHPVNKRFYSSIVTVENNVRLAPNKIRPMKRFMGNVFTLFVQCQRIRERLERVSGKRAGQDKYSTMIEKGTPLFINRQFKRTSLQSLNKYFRSALGRAGVKSELVQKATLYWMRKSFITHARSWGLGIEHVAQITGTDPKTLYDFYVQLDQIKDTNEKYAVFLDKIGMKPTELKIDVAQQQRIVPEPAQQAPVDPKYKAYKGAYEIESGDQCDMNFAAKTLNISNLRLKQIHRAGYIKGELHNKRWIYSLASIDAFRKKYIDVREVAEMLSPSKRNRIGVRWAQKIIGTTLKDYTITVGNKCYTELVAVCNLAKDRKGLTGKYQAKRAA